MNNENKKLSPSGERRIEQKFKIDDKMKLLLNKIKTEKKKKTKGVDKIKQLETEIVKTKYANNPSKLQSEIKELNKIHVVHKHLQEIKQEI